MASLEGSGACRVVVGWSMVFCASLILTAPGAGALKFLHNPEPIIVSHTGMDAEFNCTTDDPNATVSLSFSSNFGATWSTRSVKQNKLVLRGQVFTLMNLIFVDAGQYKCKAKDVSGQTAQWANAVLLFVRPAELPNYFELIPNKAIYVLQGQDRNVTCECKGVNVASLTWEKEKSDRTSYEAVPDSWVISRNDLSTNKVIAVLAIPNAQLANTGVYKCTVKVKQKSDFKLINVQVIAPKPPTVLPYTGENVIKEGSTKVVKCVASGAPKPTVSWYRNGKKINDTKCGKDSKSCENIVYEVYEEGDDPSGLHTLFTTQVLKIRSASYPRDNGEFKCVASNGVSPDAELRINFVVQGSPTIFKHMNQVLAKEGTEVNISCKLEKGNPLPTFKWQFLNSKCKVSDKDCKPDESQWQSVPEKLITPKGTPTNQSVVKVESNQDSTFYRCQAFNSLGNDSQVVRLVRHATAKAMVEIDTVKTGTEHNERSTLHIYCIDRCGIFCKPFFTKDGKKLPPVNDSRINVTHIGKHDNQEAMLVLTVKNLTRNDSGNYRCSLDINPTIFSRINITIRALVAPNVAEIQDAKVRQEIQGKGLELKCQATGNPKPSITWYFYKDGKGNHEQVNKENNNLGGNIDNCKNRRQGYYFMWSDDRSSLVICNPQFEKHQGKYECRASNSVGSVDKFAFVNVEMAPVIIEPKQDTMPPALDIGDTLNVTCKANGNPTPNVTWTKNSTGEIVSSSPTNTQLLIIESMKEEDFGVYLCTASNKLKSTVVSIDVKKVVVPLATGDGLSTGALAGIAIGVGVFVLAILVICCCLYRRQKKQIDEYKQLYFLQSSDYKIDPDRTLLEQCNDLPYDLDWEFPEERLILGSILGAGAFGQVVQAEAIGILALNPRDKSAESFKRRSKIRRSSRAKDLKKEDGGAGWKNIKIPVAVKTLKEGATRAEYKDLASELKILIHLGQHKNIVNLLGACTRGKRLMVIMEFAPHGSLMSFLRGKRDIYEANWTKTMNDPEKEFTLVDLVMVGFQVARGMSFLASRKCVHRDLAARNILVGDDYVMKIADFGLARDIYKDDLYVKKTQGLLPVKWMAPESLFDRIYTEKTDVWSFGILMWETFTLGGSPYPGLPTEQLLDYLSEGKRMEMPAKCPLEVYTIMRDCWIHEDDQRPRFTTLTERLAKILEKNTSTENPYLALQMEEEPTPTSQGYYMQPVDDAGIRESKRYVKSPVHTPTSDINDPPHFGPGTSADKEGGGMRYDSPLPTLPPGLSAMSDEDIPNEPLPPIPPPYQNDINDREEFPERANSAGGESGIDMDGVDDGYVDDARVDSPFLPPPGNKPVAIEMDKVPEAKALSKGKTNKNKIETAL